MKKFALSALLLSSPFAAAGGAGQPPAKTLQLTAPVGTAVSYQTTTKVRVQLGDVTVTARPGAEMNQETLDQTRDEIRQGFSQSMQNMTQTSTGQATYRVTGRDAAGNVTLVSTTTQSVPQAGPLTMTVTTRITPQGQVKITAVKADSSDPQVRAVLSKFTPEQLNALTGNSESAGWLYGIPLTPGHSSTKVQTADFQKYMGGLLSSLPGAEQLNLKSSPLKLQATTTYNGLNPQGLYALTTTTSQVGSWQVSLGQPGSDGAFEMEVNNVTGKTSQLYRRDGLPASQVTSMTMPIRLTLTVDDQVVSFVMNMQQEITLKQK